MEKFWSGIFQSWCFPFERILCSAALGLKLNHGSYKYWFSSFFFDWLGANPISCRYSCPSPAYIHHVKGFPTFQTGEDWDICYFCGNLVREIRRCEGHPRAVAWVTLRFINGSSKLWTFRGLGIAAAGGRSSCAVSASGLFRNHFWLRGLSCHHSSGTGWGAAIAGWGVTSPLWVFGGCNSVLHSLRLVTGVLQYHSSFCAPLN